MNRFAPLLLIVLVASTSEHARAQLPDSLSDRGRIYVLTTMPGNEVYSRYGHTAIRVLDVTLGMDVTFNYGTFDFAAPGFIRKFVQGEMDYFLSFSSTRRAVQLAEIQERMVRQQLLDIGKQERDRLYHALVTNALPENRLYRYDFLFDNCATRPLDLIELALGDEVAWDPGTATGKTFRQLLDPYHRPVPELDLGTDLVLGSRLDRTATAREEAFLPLRLEAILNAATLTDQYGTRPLVLVQDTLLWSPHPEIPPSAFPWPLGLGVLVALAGLVAFWMPPRAGEVGTIDRTILVILGLVGLLLLYMATLTAHEVTRANYNLLWAMPLHLIAAILINRVPRRVAGGYLLFSAALAAASLTGGFILPQPVPVAMAPIIVMVAIRFGILGQRLFR